MNSAPEHNRKIQAPGGICISYSISRCSNAKYTLVMLHGLASNQTRWSEFVSRTQLSTHMNLLRLDLRGHGHSMTHTYIGHKIWQQDLSAILQQESLDKVILVGHSMGAQLALHYTASHPSQVQGLILIDPTLPEKLKGWLAIAKQLRYPLWFIIVVMRLLYKLTKRHKTYPFRDLRALDVKTRELMASESMNIIADLYTSPSEDLKYMPLMNYLQDVYATTSKLPDLSQIHCPVCVLLSKGSTIVDASDIRTYFSKDTVLDSIEIDANHWPLTEKPDDTRQAIENWCQKQLTSDLA